MEVSSHALSLGRVDAITFDLAGFTNLSQDHLDFHGDMAGYFAAKSLLFNGDHSRHGVVCVDDDWGRRLAATAEVPVTTTGTDPTAGWRRVDDVDEGLAGSRTTLVDPDGRSHEVRCGLVGSVNLANATLAYVTLLLAGVAADTAREAIAGLRAVPGRMEPVDAGQPFAVLVDYAHTPAAVASLLGDARGLAASDGRVLVVLGCGGDRDRLKRPQMGAAAATGADLAVLTSDNPRSEDPSAILAAMRDGVPAGRDVEVVPDRRAAIGRVIERARPGDVVVIAGKGHEQGQDIGGQVLPFDDRVVAREALAAAAGHWAGVA
jgi:UDP-N-acetylmuramoyl-L-alanyl-D-glutamate--2,6-diaminopimelate ligase